jgi:hypothetical protein
MQQTLQRWVNPCTYMPSFLILAFLAILLLYAVHAGAAPPRDPSPVAGLPLLIPIQTRVLTGSGANATDYNIALYKDPGDPTAATLIQAPALASNTGFHVVYLRRTDLSLVSNVSIDRSQAPPQDGTFFGSPLYIALMNTPSGCGTAGCIQIVQSLGTIGFTPCFTEAQWPKDCTWFETILNELGLSSRLAYVNGGSNQIAFSSISNTTPLTSNSVAPPAGTFFERLTCSGSNYGGGPVCDQLGYPNTSFTAPQGAGPSQLGKIAGVLIRDNYRNFTFTQNARPIFFSTATDPNGPNGLTHTITVDGVPYPSSSLAGSQGGFHLLILNATDLTLVQNQTFPSKGDASEVTALYSAVTGYKSYGYLFFIASFGNTSYFCQPNSGAPCPARGNWYQGSQLMGNLGGTQQVFYLANNPQVQPFQYDTYTLVGSFTDGGSPESTPTGLTQYAAEMSSIISRETEANPPASGPGTGADMEGFLRMNPQGFYSPASFGHRLTQDKTLISDIASASLLNPTPWSFPGPSPVGSTAAYAWISQQLCCADVRAAYVNLNVSPQLWLAQLGRLTYPSNTTAFTQADFDAMAQQLATEFQYVILARLFQDNLTKLYQDQQANISLLLQDDYNKVLNNVQVGLTTPVQAASWTHILSDVFGIETSLLNAIPEGGLVAAGTEIALTVGTVVANEAASRTNSPAGTPLQAQETQEVAAGNLASKLADEFAATLISLGGDFDRIVSDWGRLKTLGAPLLAGQIPWDGNSTGLLLQGFDRLVQRELYAQLLPANFVVQHLPYTGHDRLVKNTAFHHGDLECEWETFANNRAVLYYPNGSVNNDPNDTDAGKYPWEYQWGIWALTVAQYQNASCPGHSQNYPNTFSYPDTFGLFQPLDPGNPNALGAYRYWFYTRGSLQTVIQNDNTPCYDASC